ncbi:MAG: chromate transporter [Acidobacteriia bacterium]|nr:chromate transporter [Terriglobia bacterium]
MRLPSAVSRIAASVSLKALSLPLILLGWVFLKTGLVFFGGGFVLIPILHRDIVTHLRWLTEGEFIDGVAISSLTPGPIAMISTFVGYRRFGIAGAAIATLALFLPAMVLMYIISRVYLRFKDAKIVGEFLESVIPAVVGLIAVAALQLGRKAIHNWVDGVIAAVSLVLLIRFKVNPVWLLIIMATAGFVFKMA